MLILSFIFCNLLVVDFWKRYKSNSTRMTVASNHLPLPTVQLPAITLCPVSLIDSNRLATFIDNMPPTNAHSRADLIRIFQQSAGFFTFGAYNVDELEVLQNIIDANRYSIGNIMKLIQSSCEQMFVHCQYEGQRVNCSTLFTPLTSQYGMCCTFNKNHQFK